MFFNYKNNFLSAFFYILILSIQSISAFDNIKIQPFNEERDKKQVINLVQNIATESPEQFLPDGTFWERSLEVFTKFPRPQRIAAYIQRFIQHGIPNNNVLVVRKDNIVIGMIMYKVYNHTYRTLSHSHINFLAIDKKYRKNGIGKKLLQHSISKLLRKHRVAHIELETIKSNTSAMNLYKKLGFKTTLLGKLSEKYPPLIKFYNKALNILFWETEPIWVGFTLENKKK